jgi:hypothetical protein
MSVGKHILSKQSINGCFVVWGDFEIGDLGWSLDPQRIARRRPRPLEDALPGPEIKGTDDPALPIFDVRPSEGDPVNREKRRKLQDCYHSSDRLYRGAGSLIHKIWGLINEEQNQKGGEKAHDNNPDYGLHSFQPGAKGFAQQTAGANLNVPARSHEWEGYRELKK